MNEKTTLANKPLSLKSQIMYGCCEIAGNPVYTIMMSFLTFFYTDVLGLNAGLIGSIILVSKLLDGVTDLMAGSIIEHTHTSKGSVRPWIARSAIPLAVSLVLLFTVPDVSTVGKLVYIFVSYNFAMSVCYTMYGATMNSLPLYGTDDVKTKSSAFAVRTAIAGVIQLVLVTFFMNLVEFFGGDQRAWIIIAVILAAIGLVGSLLFYNSMEENAAQNRDDTQKVPIFAALNSLLRNKYWLMLILILFLVLLHQIATLTVGVYYAKYVLNNETMAGAIGLYHGGLMTVAIFGVPVLLKKGITKKQICMACSITMLIGGIIGFVTTSMAGFIVSLALRGVGYGIISSCFNGMLADSVVYGEWKTGISCPAIGMCAYSFMQKVVVGVVTAVFGVVLAAFGYDGLAAVQPAAAVSFIKYFFLYMPVVTYVLLIITFLFFNLEKRMPKIMQDLEARHAGNLDQNA